MTESQHPFKLRRNGDQILYFPAGQNEPVPVRLVWFRPLSHRGGEVSILHARQKKEIAMLRDLDHLDPASRGIVVEELRRRYFLPKITRVVRTSASFGNRYWHVETDCGPKRFLMKSPETNATWLSDDRCLLCDTLGNYYEIQSFQKLDRASQGQAEKVL